MVKDWTAFLLFKSFPMSYLSYFIILSFGCLGILSPLRSDLRFQELPGSEERLGESYGRCHLSLLLLPTVNRITPGDK